MTGRLETAARRQGKKGSQRVEEKGFPVDERTMENHEEIPSGRFVEITMQFVKEDKELFEHIGRL